MKFVRDGPAHGEKLIVCGVFVKVLSSARDKSAVGPGVEGVAANGGYDAGRWGDYANAVAGKVGAVLFAGCVAGVEGEGKDVETECCAKSLTVEWNAGLME
jgi:hypothetical protein